MQDIISTSHDLCEICHRNVLFCKRILLICSVKGLCQIKKYASNLFIVFNCIWNFIYLELDYCKAVLTITSKWQTLFGWNVSFINRVITFYINFLQNLWKKKTTHIGLKFDNTFLAEGLFITISLLSYLNSFVNITLSPSLQLPFAM